MPTATSGEGRRMEPAEETAAARINLRVKRGGSERIFRMKTTTPLQKLMDAYCIRVRRRPEMNAFDFLFSGSSLLGDSTPRQMKLEDGDEIDVFLHRNLDEDEPPTKICLKLKKEGQDDDVKLFRMKRTTPLRKLMNAYCYQQQVERDHFVFVCRGHRLRGESTPDEVKLEDGDLIDTKLNRQNDTLQKFP